MALKTEEAWDALQALINTAAGDTLPACTRNDDELQGFADSGTPGLKWRMLISDGNVRVTDSYLGDGEKYELAVEADVVVAVEGETGVARNTLLADMLAALAEVLFPNGTGAVVDGKFDGLDIETELQRKQWVAPGEGRQPIAGWEFTIAMTLTAASPFG